MKRFKIEQSTADIVSQSGLALIRQAINRYTTLTQELDTQVPLRCPHTSCAAAQTTTSCCAQSQHPEMPVERSEPGWFWIPRLRAE